MRHRATTRAARLRRRLAVARAAVVLAAVAAVGTAGLTGCSDDGRYLRPPGTDGATARTEPEPGAAGAVSPDPVSPAGVTAEEPAGTAP